MGQHRKTGANGVKVHETRHVRRSDTCVTRSLACRTQELSEDETWRFVSRLHLDFSRRVGRAWQSLRMPVQPRQHPGSQALRQRGLAAQGLIQLGTRRGESRRHSTGFPLFGLPVTGIKRSRSRCGLLRQRGPRRARNQSAKTSSAAPSEEKVEVGRSGRHRRLSEGGAPGGPRNYSSVAALSDKATFHTTKAGEDKC